MTDTDTVLTQCEGGVLRLTLNRPDRLNAFTPEMHLGLRAGFERARDDDSVRAVLLTGMGRGFCAGQDLGQRDPRAMDGPPDLGQTLETYYHPTLRMMRALDKPIVCAVNGVAAGAGANLALCCDIVFAARSARFIQAFSKLGLVPDAGGAYLLPRFLGEPRAKALALLAEPLDAGQAEAWGLIWKAVDDDLLMQTAGDCAARLASGPTRGLGLTKRLIQHGATADFESLLDAERDLQRQAGHSPDYAEGVLAFLEKRAPEFTGR